MSLTVKRILFFVIAWLVLTASFMLAHSLSNPAPIAPSPISTAGVLLKEAKLVEYFCLSRIPPAGGSASSPKDWETVLNTDIRLADNVGEISGMSPALSAAGNELRNLKAGDHVVVNDSQDRARNYLVYRSALNPNFLLVMNKHDPQLTAVAAAPRSTPFAWKVLLTNLVAALLLTFVGSMLFSRSVQTA